MPGIQSAWIEAAFRGNPGDRRRVATGSRQPSRIFFFFQRALAEPSSSNLHSRSQPLCRWPCVPEIRPFLRPFNWNSPFYRSLWMAALWKIGKGSGLGWLQAIVETTHPWRRRPGRGDMCHAELQRLLESLRWCQGCIRQTQMHSHACILMGFGRVRLFTFGGAQLGYITWNYSAEPLPLTPF